jgi:hypothetical protein
MGFFHDDTASEAEHSIDKQSEGSKLEAEDEEEEENLVVDETETIATYPEKEDGLLSAEAEALDILAFRERESHISESHHVEFEDMGHSVCDASTALDFDRKQRNKIVQKKKKRNGLTNARRKGGEERKGDN